MDGRVYAIDIDGLGVLGDSSMNRGIEEVMIDPGANYQYVPAGTAAAIIAKWPSKPPLETSYNTTRWKVPCTDKPPPVGVKIGNTVMRIEGKDMIVYDETKHACFAAVAIKRGNGGPMIGIPFLVNVVAVYDITAADMRFHQRSRYSEIRNWLPPFAAKFSSPHRPPGNRALALSRTCTAPPTWPAYT
jgi:hypothetical protein